MDDQRWSVIEPQLSPGEIGLLTWFHEFDWMEISSGAPSKDTLIQAYSHTTGLGLSQTTTLVDKLLRGGRLLDVYGTGECIASQVRWGV